MSVPEGGCCAKTDMILQGSESGLHSDDSPRSPRVHPVHIAKPGASPTAPAPNDDLALQAQVVH